MTNKFLKWFILGATSVATLAFLAKSPVLSLHAQESESASNRSAKAAPTTRTQRAEQTLRTAINAEQQFDFKTAIKKLDEAVKLGFEDSIAHYKKGCWSFRVGDIQTSKEAFDKYVELAPKYANRQWERGITCYYAGAYEEGAQQFVDYQTYHNADVENAVWRYLCQAKFDGIEKSRKAILPIRNDPRIPMMEIYRLFRGESHPQQVLDTLAKSRSKGLRASEETCDAHLYLALYFDSMGKLGKAKQHIDLAVQERLRADYMWAVAVEHQRTVDRRIAEAAEYKKLFDGQTLKGWRGDTRYWSVQDGAIVGSTKPDGLSSNTFLIADGEYDDFVLRLQFKLVNGASGVQFRSRPLGTESEFRVTGYQADIDNSGSTGEFYEEKGRSTLVRANPDVVRKHFRKGDWNELEISMTGDLGIIKVNQHETSRYIEKDAKIPRSGLIALQLQAGDGMEIHFKNIEMREIDP